MSFNDYLQERFEGIEGTDELRDITRHGLSGGVSGFIYYSELYTLFLDFEEEILEYVTAQTGMTFSDLAAGCDNLDNLAQKAVWTYVECWAHTEYENRMTTLEEMNDENISELQQLAESNWGQQHLEVITC
tara:strand:+ start:349 stop:741 length:393 start_codon:yes stop_codon:yes gene_type:complete